VIIHCAKASTAYQLPQIEFPDCKRPSACTPGEYLHQISSKQLSEN
jgi:hypothetical protein